MGQRCQISDYEHLENVNVIKANQIPLTAIGRGSGLGRKRWAQEKWSKKKGRECQRGSDREKVAGLCPRELNKRVVKEVAYSVFLSLMALVFLPTALLMHRAREIRQETLGW